VNPVAQADPPASERAPEPPALGSSRGIPPIATPLLAAAVAAVIALIIAIGAGVVGVAAVPAVLRTAAVTVALFAICGYAPARLLARGGLDTRLPLLVLPIGAACSALELAVLGLLHVPLPASLPIVILSSAALGVLAHRRIPRAEPASARAPALTRIALPLFLAAVVGLISLVPIFRSGFATVPGQNGDAVLVVGTAVLLEHEPPTASVANNLPFNHVPIQWRSKYPIYYPLAAVSELAGQTPVQTFATVVAVMLALTALGFFLFATYALRAPPAVALLSTFLLPLDRIVMYIAIHPYYNELWGQFTLPFILLFGWRYLSSPDRISAALALLFLALGLFAYPLMIPFPAVFLIVHAWRIHRQARAEGRGTGWISRLHIPRPQKRPILWLPIVVVAVPVIAVLGRGVYEKGSEALSVVAPWDSLAGWGGTALGFLPFPRFFGMPGAGWLDYMGMAVVLVLAAIGARRVERDLRVPLVAMVLITGAIGVYFRLRTGGQLFFFKDLAFLGPYVLVLALIELAALAASVRRRPALLGAVGLIAAAAVVPASAAAEIDGTYEQGSPSVLGLRSWDKALPRGSSVRIDLGQNGWELWAIYMFSDHPLSSVNALAGFFPYPIPSRKGDYVLVFRSQGGPSDAVGPPLYQNAQFELFKLKPNLPGPEPSRHLIDPAASAQLDF
jgi:hypothetical protein